MVPEVSFMGTCILLLFLRSCCSTFVLRGFLAVDVSVSIYTLVGARASPIMHASRLSELKRHPAPSISPLDRLLERWADWKE